MKEEIKATYRTLKNNLSRVGLEDSWYVLWAYSLAIQFPKDIGKFPKDIQVDLEVLKKPMAEKGIYGWELWFLAKELVLFANRYQPLARESFKRWSYFCNTINKVKDFSNNLAENFVKNSNIYGELRRISHQQFSWQQGVGYSDFIRYYKIFNNPRISSICEEKLWIPIQTFMTIWILFFWGLISHPKVKYEEDIVAWEIELKHLNIFTNLISTNLDNLTDKANEISDINENYIYAFNPLIFYPLVKIGAYYHCPIITYLVWRITSGLYFDLNKKDNKIDWTFWNGFWMAFQDYVEEVTQTILTTRDINIYTERSYWEWKMSADLILEKDNELFFIDAKTKRLLNKSKIWLTDEAIEDDLNTITTEIVELYLTIEDYRKNLYPDIRSSGNEKIFPMIITLEDWYLFGKPVFSRINELIKLKLIKKWLPDNLTEIMPYLICSVREYEQLLQTLNTLSIWNIVNGWLDPAIYWNLFQPYLNSLIDKYEPLEYFFPDDFNNIFSKAVQKWIENAR